MSRCPADKKGCNDGVCVECDEDSVCSSLNCGAYAPYCDTSAHTCRCFGTCSMKEECASGYCCENEISVDCNSDGDRMDCVSGICGSNKKYLCDPPGWNFEEPKESNSILNFFKNLFVNPFARP